MMVTPPGRSRTVHLLVAYRNSAFSRQSISGVVLNCWVRAQPPLHGEQLGAMKSAALMLASGACHVVRLAVMCVQRGLLDHPAAFNGIGIITT
jgi:hypothetical protein